MTGTCRAQLEPIGEVQLIDISVSGARVRHFRRTSAGSEVRLKFKPSANSITLGLNGRVVWTEALDPSDPQSEMMSGIQFMDEAAGLQSAIERLCESGGATRI